MRRFQILIVVLGAALGSVSPSPQATVSVLVEARYPDSNPVPFKLYNVQYENGSSGMNSYAKTSTMLFDNINWLDNVKRVNTWTPHPHTPPLHQMSCSTTTNFKLTPAQQTYSDYTLPKNGWDRGHLTPADINLFGQDPMAKSHICVNVSPQESYSNQCVWRYREGNIATLLESKGVPAIIVTGISKASIGGVLGTTVGGYSTPTHFWKLVCYKEGTNTVVVGLKISNHLIEKKYPALRNERKAESKVIRSQREIITLTDTATVQNAWNLAIALGRPSTLGPFPNIADCGGALDVSPSVKTEWENYMNSFEVFDSDNEECVEK